MSKQTFAEKRKVAEQGRELLTQILNEYDIEEIKGLGFKNKPALRTYINLNELYPRPDIDDFSYYLNIVQDLHMGKPAPDDAHKYIPKMKLDAFAGKHNIAQYTVRKNFKNIAKQYEMRNHQWNLRNYTAFLAKQRSVLKTILVKELEAMNSIKVGFKLGLRMQKMENFQNVGFDMGINNAMVITKSTDLDATITDMFNTLLVRVDEWLNNGSGWVVNNTLNINANIYKYRPVRGGSYMELPKHIKSKMACVNIKNEDNMCFKWAVLCYYAHKKAENGSIRNADRLTHYSWGQK